MNANADGKGIRGRANESQHEPELKRREHRPRVQVRNREENRGHEDAWERPCQASKSREDVLSIEHFFEDGRQKNDDEPVRKRSCQRGRGWRRWETHRKSETTDDGEPCGICGQSEDNPSGQQDGGSNTALDTRPIPARPDKRERAGVSDRDRSISMLERHDGGKAEEGPDHKNRLERLDERNELREAARRAPMPNGPLNLAVVRDDRLHSAVLSKARAQRKRDRRPQLGSNPMLRSDTIQTRTPPENDVFRSFQAKGTGDERLFWARHDRCGDLLEAADRPKFADAPMYRQLMDQLHSPVRSQNSSATPKVF